MQSYSDVSQTCWVCEISATTYSVHEVNSEVKSVVALQFEKGVQQKKKKLVSTWASRSLTVPARGIRLSATNRWKIQKRNVGNGSVVTGWSKYNVRESLRSTRSVCMCAWWEMCQNKVDVWQEALPASKKKEKTTRTMWKCAACRSISLFWNVFLCSDSGLLLFLPSWMTLVLFYFVFAPLLTLVAASPVANLKVRIMFGRFVGGKACPKHDCLGFVCLVDWSNDSLITEISDGQSTACAVPPRTAQRSFQLSFTFSYLGLRQVVVLQLKKKQN